MEASPSAGAAPPLPPMGGDAPGFDGRPDGEPGMPPQLRLPQVSVVGMSAMLCWGSTVRYALSCGAWSASYAAMDAYRGVGKKDAAKKRWRMWMGSHALELGASLLLVPGRYLTAKHAPRLLVDFASPVWGDALAAMDAFSPPHFLSYAINRMTPAGDAEYDFSFFLWHLPATLVTAGKLFLRRRRKPEATRTKTCAAVLGLQYCVRLLTVSYALYLPASEGELVFAGLLMTIDKALDAFLIRNTWPCPAMVAAVEIAVDRVGEAFVAGEAITGCVAVSCAADSKHGGIRLRLVGSVRPQTSTRPTAFDDLAPLVKPLVFVDREVTLVDAGQLPKGATEIPFAVPLQQSGTEPLRETYQGVYVASTYVLSCQVAAAGSGAPRQARDVPIRVTVPGQAAPDAAALEADEGVDFSLSDDTVRASRKVGAGKIPSLRVHGRITRKFNDADVPLAGFVRVDECGAPVTSVEIQLIRAEAVAVADGLHPRTTQGRELTEVQNIQIGDGNVRRGLEIPVHMMFPRWFTSAALRTPNLKVDFEINVVVTIEGGFQITQHVPIILYRGTPQI